MTEEPVQQHAVTQATAVPETSSVSAARATIEQAQARFDETRDNAQNRFDETWEQAVARFNEAGERLAQRCPSSCPPTWTSCAPSSAPRSCARLPRATSPSRPAS